MFVIFVSLLSFVAAAQKGRDLGDASEVYVYKKTNEAELRAFVYTPDDHDANATRPAIVFFHGGGWRSGSPSQFAPHCRLLASKGMVAVAVEYRLTRKHGVPAWKCLVDAKSAMRWVRAHAAELGIDPERIAVGGGSAGGHLAACIGLGVEDFDDERDDLSVSPAASAMVLFNPVLNLAKIPDRYGWHGKNLKASPQDLVKPGAPPAIIFHGTADTTVPYTQAEQFEKTMNEAGNDCRLVGFEGAGHGFFNYGRGDGSDYVETTKMMVDFLDELGYITAD